MHSYLLKCFHLPSATIHHTKKIQITLKDESTQTIRQGTTKYFTENKNNFITEIFKTPNSTLIHPNIKNMIRYEKKASVLFSFLLFIKQVGKKKNQNIYLQQEI